MSNQMLVYGRVPFTQLVLFFLSWEIEVGPTVSIPVNTQQHYMLSITVIH